MPTTAKAECPSLGNIEHRTRIVLALAAALFPRSVKRGAIWIQTAREEALVDSLQRVTDRERLSVRKPCLSSNV